jgi:tryptophan halogenase
MEYDRVRDFLILHYHATERDDSPFWTYVRMMPVPDSLAEKMALFKRRGRVVKYREGAFLDASWVSVYLGQRVVPTGADPRAAAPSTDSLVAGLDRMRGEIAAAVGAMPAHAAFLAGYCPMPAAT